MLIGVDGGWGRVDVFEVIIVIVQFFKGYVNFN